MESNWKNVQRHFPQAIGAEFFIRVGLGQRDCQYLHLWVCKSRQGWLNLGRFQAFHSRKSIKQFSSQPSCCCSLLICPRCERYVWWTHSVVVSLGLSCYSPCFKEPHSGILGYRESVYDYWFFPSKQPLDSWTSITHPQKGKSEFGSIINPRDGQTFCNYKSLCISWRIEWQRIPIICQA